MNLSEGRREEEGEEEKEGERREGGREEMKTCYILTLLTSFHGPVQLNSHHRKMGRDWERGENFVSCN